ncbi:MAG: methyltransferase family protein [Candidatus Hodarchaeales archaeon]
MERSVINVEFFPPLVITWLGGWLLLIWLYIVPTITLTTVSKEVRSRLLDRSKFTRSQVIFTVISKIIALITQIIVILTPLAFGMELIIGVVMFSLGILGEVIAVINFVKTPLDEPVTRGIYKFSRNPQETMISLAMFGACFAVGSWSVIILFSISRMFNHFQIIAQEQSCLQEYGQTYQDYMDRVPRYFLFL